MAPVSMTLSDL